MFSFSTYSRWSSLHQSINKAMLPRRLSFWVIPHVLYLNVSLHPRSSEREQQFGTLSHLLIFLFFLFLLGGHKACWGSVFFNVLAEFFWMKVLHLLLVNQTPQAEAIETLILFVFLFSIQMFPLQTWWFKLFICCLKPLIIGILLIFFLIKQLPFYSLPWVFQLSTWTAFIV